MRRWPICRNKAAMQILKCFLTLCVAAFCLTALSLRADDNATQSASPVAKSQITIVRPAEPKKQAEVNARTCKQADKPTKVKAEPEKQSDAQTQKEAQTKVVKAKKSKPEQSTTQAQVETKPATVKPVEKVPLPISADKQQRLTELLRKYKADELTSEQYQAERAKILAEP